MGLVTGAQYIRAGTYKTVLVIGAQGPGLGQCRMGAGGRCRCVGRSAVHPGKHLQDRASDRCGGQGCAVQVRGAGAGCCWGPPAEVGTWIGAGGVLLPHRMPTSVPYVAPGPCLPTQACMPRLTRLATCLTTSHCAIIFSLAGALLLPCLPAGADALSRYIDWRDRGTCILFGDGCGAVVLRSHEGGCGLLGMDMHSGGWINRTERERGREGGKGTHAVLLAAHQGHAS